LTSSLPPTSSNAFKDVLVRPAVQLVGTGPAEHAVVALVGRQEVVARLAAERVVAEAAPDVVVPCAAAQLVVAAIPQMTSARSCRRARC